MNFKLLALYFLILFLSLAAWGQTTNTMIVDWGDDTYSQLFYPFISIDASQLSTGYEHTLGIIGNTSVQAWGNSRYGQLSVPSGILNPIKVSAGLGHSLVLQQNGTVKGWGFNDYGQTNVSSLTDVIDIAAGDEHSVVVFSDGSLQVISNGSTTYNLTPPPGLANVRAVVSGNFHILALKTDSTVVAWGSNEFGQSAVPSGLNGVIAVSAGQFHSFALLKDGSLVGWGDNVLFDQITLPSGISNVKKIETGNFHSLALNGSNTFYTWGSDRFGEGVTPKVLKDRTIHEITAGFAHNTLIVSNQQPSMGPQATTIFVDEDTSPNTLLTTLNASDPDTQDGQKFSLVSGSGSTDNSSFKIQPYIDPTNITNDIAWGNFPQINYLVNLISFNYEVDSMYNIRLRITDLGGLTDEKAVIVQIRNVNEAVLSLSLDNDEVEEKRPVATVVGTFSSTDKDLYDSHSFSLINGDGSTDNASFTISGNTLLTSQVFIHELQSAYEIRVRSTDPGGLTYEEKFTIKIIPVNRVPSDILLSADSVFESAPVGSLVGFFSTIDLDTLDNFTYELATGSGDSDNSSFLVNSNALLTNTIFNLNEKSTYTIRVKSTDDGKPSRMSIEKPFTIRVVSKNELPVITDQEFTIPETTPGGTVIGTVVAIDDGPIMYSILSGNTGNAFAIEASSGVLSVSAGTQLEYDAQSDYFLRVHVIDLSGETAQSTVSIHLEEVQIFPEVTDQTFEIFEDSPSGLSVGFFLATGKNALRFAIISGNEDDVFSIIGESGEIVLKDSSALNSISTPIYTLGIWVYDGQEETETTASAFIVVRDANYTPASIALDNQSILERQFSGTRVGLLSTEDHDPGDRHTYTLQPDQGFFKISGNALLSNVVFNYRERQEYTITVRSTDDGSPEKYLDANFVISILPGQLPIIPKAITPNNDGVNDTWIIENLDLYERSETIVYDRFGQNVFTSKGYTSPWDGTYLGRPLPVASYYYVIRLHDPVGTTYSGTITILRE